MTPPSFRDVEQISAFLDGKLPQGEAARLQMRIAANPELASIYRQLSQTRTLLRSLPARRAPRNFTLTPHMTGLRAPTPRSFPLLRFASVFASLLLLLTFAFNGISQLAANAPAAAPAYGEGGGPMIEAMEQPAAPAPQLQSGGGGNIEIPAAAPSDAAQDSAAPAEESMRSLAVEPTQTTEELPFAKMDEEEMQAQRALESPAREPFQIPGWLQLGLLAAAVLTGGLAWFVNRLAQVRFDQKYSK